MKFSGERAEPPGVITTTGTVPCPGGSVTVIVVQSGVMLTMVAVLLPKHDADRVAQVRALDDDRLATLAGRWSG